MLVYQLMPASYALDDLRRRRLKVSLLGDMNDPFELLGARLERAEHRAAIRKWRDYMNRISRVLCFSKNWMNPLLWSHYADKHRGICLGFEVPKEYLLAVSYEVDRLELQVEEAIRKNGTVGDQIAKSLLTTKFADWQYENEVRMFARPEEVYEESGLQFYPFTEKFVLKKVILGPRSTVSAPEARASLQPQEQGTEIIATRLAFKSFRVIRTPIRS